MFDPLRAEAAPAYFNQSVWNRVTQPRPVPVRSWVLGSLSVGMAALLLTFYISPDPVSPTPDPLAETYITIDNPWIAHQPNELALLE